MPVMSLGKRPCITLLHSAKFHVSDSCCAQVRTQLCGKSVVERQQILQLLEAIWTLLHCCNSMQRGQQRARVLHRSAQPQAFQLAVSCDR